MFGFTGDDRDQGGSPSSPSSASSQSGVITFTSTKRSRYTVYRRKEDCLKQTKRQEVKMSVQSSTLELDVPEKDDPRGRFFALPAAAAAADYQHQQMCAPEISVGERERESGKTWQNIATKRRERERDNNRSCTTNSQ